MLNNGNVVGFNTEIIEKVHVWNVLISQDSNLKKKMKRTDS
jgi:hypothetical protein